MPKTSMPNAAGLLFPEPDLLWKFPVSWEEGPEDCRATSRSIKANKGRRIILPITAGLISGSKQEVAIFIWCHTVLLSPHVTFPPPIPSGDGGKASSSTCLLGILTTPSAS